MAKSIEVNLASWPTGTQPQFFFSLTKKKKKLQYGGGMASIESTNINLIGWWKTQHKY